jgi:hypothetical protein
MRLFEIGRLRSSFPRLISVSLYQASQKESRKRAVDSVVKDSSPLPIARPTSLEEIRVPTSCLTMLGLLLQAMEKLSSSIGDLQLSILSYAFVSDLHAKAAEFATDTFLILYQPDYNKSSKSLHSIRFNNVLAAIIPV